MSLHEIHREAEMLEHQTSDYLAERISDFLDDPQVDPRGDAIPDSNGLFLSSERHSPLSMAAEGGRCTITRLNRSEKEFFDFCRTSRLVAGASLEGIGQYIETGLTETVTEDNKLLLSEKMTQEIYTGPSDVV